MKVVMHYLFRHRFRTYFSLILIVLLLLASCSPQLKALPAAASSGNALTPAPNPPTLTVSLSNAASVVPNPITITETSPYALVRGAHLTRSIDSLTAISDSTTPVSSNSFQTYSVEIDTDSAKLDVRFRGAGIRYRIWIDGHPISVNPTVAPNGGFYRVTMTFPSRQLHQIRYESDATRFNSFTVSKTDSLIVPPKPIIRAIIVGDSFAEGTGANGRFNAFGQTLCTTSGWDDCWVDGSGGTGYLNNGATGYVGRATFRQRIVHDVLQYNPSVIVIAGGKNDMLYPPSQVHDEALALFKQIRQSLPNVNLIVTSPFPSSGPQAQSSTYASFNSAVKSASTGLADKYLDITGVNAYITGTGNTAHPNGTGNADLYTGPDGVHPAAAGHDMLGSTLHDRYVIQ